MDNKSEMFDLQREKRELDAFLSTIEETDASSPLPKGSEVKKEAVSVEPDDRLAFQPSYLNVPGWKAGTPVLKSETAIDAAIPKDKTSMSNVNEFIPRTTGTGPLDFTDQQDSGREKLSPLMSLDDEKKTDTISRVAVPQSVKPLESFKTMTRFDGTTKPAEDVLAEVPLSPLSAEKKILPESEAEKKSSKTSSPYDFSPEKKAGVGKWIWVLLILIALLVAGYFVFTSNLFVTGPGNIFKSKQSAITSSTDEIKLYNVRQRLIYNTKMQKSIRVIEGIAENNASYPVSKIKIAANLYNAEGSVITSMESFGGSILIDSKLETLDADGLMASMKTGKASEDRIPPRGQIPFMIIFAGEVAGVHKLSVVPVDFVK